jgi:putative ABC transport system permease protein
MFWRKRRSLDDLQAEIESHLALEADEIGETGDQDAAARRAFGNITAVEEQWYEHGRWTFFDSFARELRQGIRQIRRRPGFSLFVISSLALGIGANSAIFSIVDAVLLHPLPYNDPGRLAMIFSGDPARELYEGRVSLLNFYDWKARSRSFADMTAYIPQTFLLQTGSVPERMRSARVSANFWPLLGVQPMLGRVFTEAEESRGDRLAVLSYELWREQFAGSMDVLGQPFTMDDRTYAVIGVMPPAFHFPFADTRVWEPVTAHPYWTERDQTGLRSDSLWLVLGRLKAGVSWSSAQEEMNRIARDLRTRHPSVEMPDRIPLVPLDIHTSGKFRLSLWLLLGSVFLILLIACINVAGLLLARGSARDREFAIRRALGASRLRIAGQLLTETLVLSCFGGVIGLLLASLGCSLFRTFGPKDIPRLTEAGVDWAVVFFTLCMTVFAALAASLWPALQNSRTRVASRQWTSAYTRLTGDLLVAGQFALALILMISATLLARSFLRLRAVEMGFRPEHLLAMRVDLHVGKTTDQEAAYFEEAIRRASAIPGVLSTAAITGFLRTDPENSVQIEGRPLQHPGPCEDLIAGPFFKAAGIPINKGRGFTDADRRGAPPVGVINETMARTYWPGDDPIGKRFRFDQTHPWITVVGVSGDMRRQGVDHPVAPQVFRPHRQGSENMMDLIVRTAAEPGAMANTIQKEIQSVDKSVARFRILTVIEELADQAGERRFDTFLVSTFAIAAVFLSAVGVYVLLHYLVMRRAGEIGVRMALGATPEGVMAMILRQGLALAFLGAGVGVLGALSVCSLLSKLLYEIKPTDPATFGIAVFALIAVAAIACWIPSRRAARIDPIAVLHQD